MTIGLSGFIGLGVFIRISGACVLLILQNGAETQEKPRVERVLDLSIDEAVRRAITYNPQITSAQLQVEAAGAGIDEAIGAFEPSVFFNPRVDNSARPTASTLAGASRLENNTLHLDTGLRQALPTGGSYQLTFQTDNSRTNNSFSTLNPSTFSTFALSFTQPLLRGAWTGYGRIPQSKAESAREQAVAQRDQQKIDIIQLVHNSYWDLAFANADRDVKLRSLSLAERLLEINRKKVEEGLLAPVEIYQAQADVATRREALLTADNNIRAAEDALKQLLFPFDDRSEWTFRIHPVSAPPLPGSVDIPKWEDAVTEAFAKRPDLLRTRLDIQNRELDLEARKHETMPQVNFVGSASNAGLGAAVDQTFRDIAKTNYPSYSLGLQIEIPLGNLAARSRERAAEALVSVSRAQLRTSELAVAREVRDAVRQVSYGNEKVAAARKSREFAEKQLQAEELRFEQGLSTNFEVLSLQRDLAQALTNEQQAILDFAKATISLEKAKGTLGGR
ncbi:MAG: TolC family protein [Planctomycetes bacterium]|nr:TolC family protein [Planctomycetota bacterium]